MARLRPLMQFTISKTFKRHREPFRNHVGEMKKRTSIIIGCLVLAGVLILSGCVGPKKEKTAAQLAVEGQKYYKDGDYKKAVDAFKRLKDWYPYSSHAKNAELKIADAHFHMKEYEEAIFGYTEYERLYPSDPKIPYIIYQTGRCYYDRMDGIDRDQTPAQKALDTFRRLNSRFPDSAYADKSAPLIENCLKSLAGHEYYVGHFYYRAQHYKAALDRFLNVVTKYPDVGYTQKALKYIALCKDKQNEAPPKRLKGETIIQSPLNQTPVYNPNP